MPDREPLLKSMNSETQDVVDLRLRSLTEYVRNPGPPRRSSLALFLTGLESRAYRLQPSSNPFIPTGLSEAGGD
jgi:hypothetical protein